MRLLYADHLLLHKYMVISELVYHCMHMVVQYGKLLLNNCVLWKLYSTTYSQKFRCFHAVPTLLYYILCPIYTAFLMLSLVVSQALNFHCEKASSSHIPALATLYGIRHWKRYKRAVYVIRDARLCPIENSHHSLSKSYCKCVLL